MTREEAIRLIGWLKCTTNREDDLEAIDMAIEALSVANLKEEFESAEYEDYEHATLVDIKEPLKVLVVRCKDCRHYAKGHCYMYGGQMNDDDYCSHGERQCNYFGERKE